MDFSRTVIAKSRIFVYGAIPQADLELLTKIAIVKEIAIEHVPDLSKMKFSENNLPSGCVSFLPCTEESIGNLFLLHPLGLGENIPLFQRIETEDPPVFLDKWSVNGVFHSPLTRIMAMNIVNSINYNFHHVQHKKDLFREIMNYRKQKSELIQIGTVLSRENDLEKLLELILTVSRDIVCADAGSVYVREREGHGGPFSDKLRFKVSQNDSVKMKTPEFSLQINMQSIAGFVAFTGKPLTIKDVNCIDKTQPYTFNSSIQEKNNYYQKSMLALPLKNLDDKVVGVLQLINKKPRKELQLVSQEIVSREVMPFSDRDEDFISSIASYAAVSIERADFYENIQAIFEGFLSSSIAAIDERDRVTSGHSRRVMGYAKAFLETAALDPSSPFAALCESEDRRDQFRFAALLHDIGKIGVPERVLTKTCRLDEGAFAAIMARMDYITLLMETRPGVVKWKSADELERDREFIERINKSGYLSDTDLEHLTSLRSRTYCNAKGRDVELLSEHEFEALSVRAGNLTAQERDMINSHAQSTYRILSKIPWTRRLEQIPIIACSHHEKLDGSGYPQGLRGDQIGIESRILAVIDIYEALVAQDRPYKPKMAPEKALAILQDEVDKGHLDAGVVKYFIDQNIYATFLNSDSGNDTNATALPLEK